MSKHYDRQHPGRTEPSWVSAMKPVTETAPAFRAVHNRGTIARVAIQCVDPETGLTGSWLFTGVNHRDKGARVSPLFDDLSCLFPWINHNHWKQAGSAGEYLFQP